MEVQNLIAHYDGKRVIGPISLSLKVGQCTALVGLSGAGKSTLLDLLYKEFSGRAAYIPQELGLVNSLSVFHNTYMGRLSDYSTWHNLTTLFKPRQRDIQQIAPLLDQVAIGDKLWSPVATLSGGEKQRTAVARALFQKAPILLADEPVSALDGPMAETVMQALTSYYSTAVIALHDVRLALKYADRVVCIQDGMIVQDAPASNLTLADLNAFYG